MRFSDLFQIEKVEKREKMLAEETVDDVLLRAILNDESIDRNSAMEIPIVSSSVDKVCNTFASIPFRLYRKIVDEKGKRTAEEVEDNRVLLINNDTKDTLDGFQFKKAICEDYLLGKGGYAYIKKINNAVKSIHYVKEQQISLAKNENPIFKSYDILVNGEIYKNYEFIKLLRNTKDGASGIGLTKEISRALKTGYKRLQYEYDLTATGGSRKGFIKSPKRLGEKEMKVLKQAWEDYYSGNANTVILNDGLEFQEASNSSQQNEINSKNITFIQEILNVFHISENQSEFVKSAIQPIADAFVTALNRDLLLESEKDEYYWAYDLSELLKGNLAERYQAYATAIRSGFKTRNEIRYLENDNAIKGLDMIELSLGSVLLNSETGELYTPNTNETVAIDNLNNKGVSEE